MSISNQNQKVSRSGDGTSHQFNFDFRIAQAADLVVIVRNDTTGVAVTKTLDTHFIIPTSSVNSASGGNILFKFNTGTPSDAHYSTTDQRPQNGETIIIKRVVQLTQGVDLQAADSLPADTLEDAYDKLTFGLQQVQEELGRALLRPATDSASAALPDNVDLKGKVLQFNSTTGAPEAIASLTDTATSTVPGLMSTADKVKLDGIETGATGDQDAAEIRTLVESATDSNVFTDADHSKLDGIEANATADQTDSEIKTAYENNSDTNAFTDSEKTKLSGVESGATADQTDAEIRTLVNSATDSNVFTDADHTKLDNIEANATADQTDTEIKTAYENNSNTNAFTDAEQTKLSGIESGATADQTASDIRGLGFFDTSNDGTGSGLDADKLDGQEGTYYQPANTALTTSSSFGGDVSGTYNAIVIADDSHNHVISNVDNLQTALDAKAPLASPTLTGTPSAPTAAADTSTTQLATTAFVQQELTALVGSAPSTLDTLNEIAAAINDDPNFNTTVTNSLANRVRVDTASQGLTSTQQNNAKTNLGLDDVATSGAYSDLSGTPSNATTSTDGLMSSSDKTKLDAVEASATADQTDAEIKTAYENNSDTNALTDALLSKLNAIEASATADQTASEIRTLVESATDSNVFTDADHTKLNGIEANATADQTASELLTAIKTVDGTTSGLDADVLDGQEGSHYLNYNNFTNTPTIPTNNSELTNGAGYLTSVPAQSFSSLTGKPTTISGYGITDAFNGAYSSLTGTPTIPTATSDLTNDSGFISSTLSGNLDLNGNELILDADGDTSIHASTDDQIDFKVGGNDELILNTIQLYPNANNGLSLGASTRRFNGLFATTANFVSTTVSSQMTSTLATGTAPLVIASTTKVANLNVDKLDDQEGSYYLDYNNFTNTPTIPTAVSDLTNDSGFTTNVGDITGVTAGTGLSGGGDSGGVTLNLANTSVSAGSYTNTNLTVDAQGRITAASSGSAGSSLSNIADVTGGVAVTGDLVVNDTATTTWTKPAQFLVGNLGSNQNAQFTFGKDLSANDLVEFSFHHVSSGSSSNYQTMGFYGSSNRLALRTDGSVSINTPTSSPVFDGALRVDGDTLITGDLEVQGGLLDLKNAGSQSEVRLYCESSNAHYAALKAPAHSDFSGNVDLTLPATTSTLLSTTSTLNDLANVSVSSPSNGQVLKYVSAESRWEAADDATGSGGSTNADTVDNKHISVVSSLPASPDANTIYFVTS